MFDFRTSSRIEWRLFLAAWLAYAFFHQGGGWHQNARFATVRAIVEEGRFAVDSYVFYSGTRRTDDGYRLTRTPIEDGVFRLHGAGWAVTWSDRDPLRGDAEEFRLTPLSKAAATADLAYAEGHLYPSQAPGTALISVPGYFLIYHLERLIGLDHDNWWVFTVNGWLTNALGVGLISALGCIVFLRTALLLWGGRLPEATWATLTFAFATLFFPYATLMYDHNVVAVMLLFAFYFLLRAAGDPTERKARLALLLAGLTAGYASISSYIAVVPVLFLAVYLLVRVKRKNRWVWFGLGLAGPFLLFCFYNQICFGTPVTTPYHFQNPQLHESGALLSMLVRPRFVRLAAVLVSPFRGLFFSSPVLLMGVVGLVEMWRGGRRAETLLCSSMLGFLVLATISFVNCYGGWGVGPRHLIPSLPFLALPLVVAFRRYFKTTLVLAVLSALTMACLTAVDVRSPVGLTWIAKHPGRSTLAREPLTEYALPILFTGKARPILNAQIDDRLRRAEVMLRDEGTSPEEAEERLEAYRERLESLLEEGGMELPLTLHSGPVSANPMGLYEAWYGRVFKPGEQQLLWNSFNAGELLLPHSVFSLLYLLILWLPLSGSALAIARRSGSAAGAGPGQGK